MARTKAATDAAIRVLVACVAGLTLIALIAVFGVWTSAGNIVAAVGRKSRTVKEASDGSSFPEVKKTQRCS